MHIADPVPNLGLLSGVIWRTNLDARAAINALKVQANTKRRYNAAMEWEEFIRIAKEELNRHNFSYFTEVSNGVKVTVAGCPECKLRIQTMEQFMRHLTDDVLPIIAEQVCGNSD